ncbi:MAG: QueT transporter family protein [Erysipelotrichaceae bacterium]|nr:QueT transporter family protein [Erysipelotrichaceae bacterium]
MTVRKITMIAMIAALYTVICLLPGISAISFGQIQVRMAEMLTMLPLIYQPSIYGLTLGCFLSNLIGALTGLNPLGYLDCVIGTAATLIAAILTYKLRNRTVGKLPLWSMLMPVIWNFLFVGLELACLMMPEDILKGLLIFGGYVALGEIIAVILGYLLIGNPAVRGLFSDNR